MQRAANNGGLPLVVLTGAGLSADSGLATFRGAGGLWQQYDVRQLATAEAFWRDPVMVWQFYGERRRLALAAKPNAGHLALAALEKRLDPASFTLMTQNVDGLHARAGATAAIELHGSLLRTRCSQESCRAGQAGFDDARLTFEKPPTCPFCGQLQRPDVVWFNEMLPAAALAEAYAAAGRAATFLAVGTSGMVYPAAALVEVARAAGAISVAVNLEAPENAHRFGRIVLGSAAKTLPALLDELSDGAKPTRT